MRLCSVNRIKLHTCVKQVWSFCIYFPIPLCPKGFFDFNIVEKPVDNVDNFCLYLKKFRLYTSYVNFPPGFQKDIRPLLSIQPVFILNTDFSFSLPVDNLMKLCITPMLFPFHAQGKPGFPVYKSVQTVENPVRRRSYLPVIDKYPRFQL